MLIGSELRRIAKQYAEKLNKQITQRVSEMNGDDHSHFLIYRVLGITVKEGELIDTKGGFCTNTLVRFSKKQLSCVLNISSLIQVP